MIIEEAIEMNQNYYDRYFRDMPSKQGDAFKLGIEALKRCQELRSPKNWSPMRPLPGESPEEET